MQKQIELIHPKEISPFKDECERANLTFSGRTNYIGVKEEGKLVAFTGWVEYGNKIVFKNGYISPAHRGKGYWKAMIAVKLGIAVRKNKKVEATCTRYSLKYFLQLGARVIKEYKNNTTKVIFDHDSLLKAERMGRRFRTLPMAI